jgi:Sap, sulfolipid-1-addressing protein
VDGAFFGLAFLAAVNPKLLGVDLLIIDNRRPRAMFLCFLAGGMGLSVTLGVLDVTVFEVDAIRTQSSSSATLDLVLGIALLTVGALVGTGRVRRREKVHPGDGKPKKESWAVRALREPHLVLAVVIGALSGTPGATYITALHHLVTGSYSTATEIAAVVVFNLIMFSPVIVPLVFLETRPEATRSKLRYLNEWISGHARQLIAGVLLAVGAYMTISGFVRLLAG